MRASHSAHPPLCAPFAPLRSHANRCCAAQAEQLQRPGDADYNGHTRVGAATTEAFAVYVIFLLVSSSFSALPFTVFIVRRRVDLFFPSADPK